MTNLDVEPLGNLHRTNTAGELTAADTGKDVVLLGWVHRVRDLGSLVFFDLRDRHGVTQIVAREDHPEAVQVAGADFARRLLPRVGAATAGDDSRAGAGA